MRLSVKKVAHNCFSASAAPQEIREAIDLFVVFSQGKPLLAIFIKPRNCETALIGSLAFVLEKPPFALDAAAVTGERTVGSNHPVAGHDDPNRI